MVDQHRLRAHHVADGDDRKVEAIGLAGRRIGRGRAGRAHAAAEHVGADDEEAVGVDRPAGADHRSPTSRLAGDGIRRRWRRCWSPVSAWQIRMALDLSALSVRHRSVGEANYSVHADDCAGDAAMRDSVRFHFGFTVPYLTHHGARGVIEAVARSCGDLGMVRVDAGTAAGAWWGALTDPSAPKIIARLPFVERPDHPAGLPVFLVAQPLAEAAARDLTIWSLSLDRWSGGLPAALGALGGEILGNAPDGIGLSLLVSAPGAVDATALRAALTEAGAGDARIAEAGSHAARYSFSAQRHPGVTA
jgi:hypothetical protein